MKLRRGFGGVRFGLILAAVLSVSSCHRQASDAGPGGRLVSTVRQEPETLNRLISTRPVVVLLTMLTQETLVRVNRVTGVLEPRLARDWTPSADGLTYTLTLRPEAQFSDGTPVTSADVAFTFG